MTISSSETQQGLEYTCQRCGRINTPIQFDVLGATKFIRRTCQCVQEENEKEEAIRAELERKQRIERLFSAAELGPRFQECTFKTWQQRPGAGASYQAAINYVADWKKNKADGMGLIIYGPPGNGKSHLAAAVVNKLLAQWVSCIFRSVPSLLKRIQSSWDGEGAKEKDILRALTDADLLVLDDAGAEKWSDWSETTLYYIIDERYRWKRPVIVTSNCSLDEFEDRIGFRAFDRLIETCTVIENSASSYRKDIARRRVRAKAGGN